MSDAQQEAVKKYYEDTPISTWEKVFDSDLNYCFGDAITRNPDVFKSVKTIYDVGAGWGGPARRLAREYNIEVECVTHSEPQANYIRNRDGFHVYHEDATVFVPEKKYDMAIFFQSFTHMNDDGLINASKVVDKIFVNDFINATGPRHYTFMWDMIMRSVEDYKNLFESIGFEIKKFEIQPREIYIPHSKFWLENINKLPKEELTPEIIVLKLLCEDNTSGKYLPFTQIVDIYAERKKGA